MSTDTIYALATAAGRAGIAVIRLSGPRVGDVLARFGISPLPAPRRAVVHDLVWRGTDGEVAAAAAFEWLDQALVLWFPAPASFTGEDVAELHVHGSPAVIGALLDRLGRLAFCRMARAGEFSRRAFDNGKMDLTALEGLADLLAAETGAQRHQALAHAAGRAHAVFEHWRARLLAAFAHIEAVIDFADEPDIADELFAAALADVRALLAEIEQHLAQRHRGEIIRDGFQVVIIGAPNAGKSSLLNALAARDVAIVSDRPGTTRDQLSVRLDLDGLAVELTDTAGLRASDDEIEREGIRRARAAAAAADALLVVTDLAAANGVTGPAMLAADLLGNGCGFGGPVVHVGNKLDLVAAEVDDAGADMVRVSARTGAGIGALMQRLGALAHEAAFGSGEDEGAGEAQLITRARHFEVLAQVAADLRAAPGWDVDHAELAAEDVRRAVAGLGRLTGRIDVEEVLGQIFSDFCIGK